MKTITQDITLYQFDELSDRAKDNAIESMGANDMEHERFEIRKTIQAFEEHMNVTLDWEIDYTDSMPTKPTRASVPWYLEDADDPENIESLKDAVESLGSYDPETLKGYGDCVLTGVIYDEEIADGARYAFYREGSTDRAYVAKRGMDFLEKTIHQEYAYKSSYEHASELADANDYWFTENGRLWG